MPQNKLKLTNYFYKEFFIILSLILVLCTISVILQISAGNSNFYTFAAPQLVKILVGFIVFAIVYCINPNIIFKNIEVFYILCLILVILVEVLGSIRLGAQRWLHFGLLIIQPSELMKIAIVLMLAKLLATIPEGREGKLNNYVLALILSIFPSLLILLQPDLGTASIILVTSLVIFFVSGLKLRYFVIAGICTICIAPIIWFNLYKYQQDRILTFIEPDRDPLGRGYHIIQSKIAIGSGGFWGKGYLQGSQSQLDFIPEKQTDFIFALLTEEFGFIGALLLLIIYMMIILYCIKLSLKSDNKFISYSIVGLTFMFFIQIFFNIGMVIGILPVVGIPLPLISYGGTSIITILSSLALILNFSRKTSS